MSKTRKISIAFPLDFNSRGAQNKYAPMIEKIGDRVENVYGIRSVKDKNDNKPNMVVTWIPSLVSWHIVKRLQKIFKYPDYYTYLSNVFCFDLIMAKRIARDNSEILFTSPLLKNTVKCAKQAGKIVVVEAGNSEPEREYKRVSEDYLKYKINNKYIYGNPIYNNICKESFENADFIISISKVSLDTYRESGYDLKKFKLISLAGTDFEKQKEIITGRKKRAFITTAFHSFIKGTHRLLLAWRKAEIRDIPLIIVGNLCEDIKQFIDENGPFDNVIFVGPQSNLAEWYLDYDAVGILLSLSEGAGRVVPEMMSFGFPMITSMDASCDLVKNNENGFIVDVFNENDIIDKLRYFAEDWDRVKQMRKTVLQSVSKRTIRDFSIELADFLSGL